MSGLDDLKKRIDYRGGQRQQDRMNNDKVASLKKALIYSYQSATAIMEDGREFRCLINNNSIKMDEDNKVISMPFKDICLNAEKDVNKSKTHEGAVETGIDVGQIIEWKDNGTHWLIYNQYLQECAYFRGELRRCDYEIDLNGKRYWIYFKRAHELLIDWKEKVNDYLNTLNYTALMYITNTEETNAFFKRFAIIKINGEPWEVQSVDRFSTKGILIVTLKEWYKNSIEEAAAAERAELNPVAPDTSLPHIIGVNSVYPYSTYSYSVEGLSGGSWYLNNTKAKITEQTGNSVKITIVTGRSGTVELHYKTTTEDIVFPITIESL